MFPGGDHVHGTSVMKHFSAIVFLLEEKALWSALLVVLEL